MYLQISSEACSTTQGDTAFCNAFHFSDSVRKLQENMISPVLTSSGVFAEVRPALLQQLCLDHVRHHCLGFGANLLVQVGRCLDALVYIDDSICKLRGFSMNIPQDMRMLSETPHQGELPEQSHSPAAIALTSSSQPHSSKRSLIVDLSLYRPRLFDILIALRLYCLRVACLSGQEIHLAVSLLF